MAEPWFDPATFGAWFGGLAGGLGGVLMGVIGGLTPWLAMRGKGGRPVVSALSALLTVFGVLSAIVGIIAVAVGQPYMIWYPLLLVGVIMGGVGALMLFVLIPVTYRAADGRRMAAEQIRSDM